MLKKLKKSKKNNYLLVSRKLGSVKTLIKSLYLTSITFDSLAKVSSETIWLASICNKIIIFVNFIF